MSAAYWRFASLGTVAVALVFAAFSAWSGVVLAGVVALSNLCVLARTQRRRRAGQEARTEPPLLRSLPRNLRGRLASELSHVAVPSSDERPQHSTALAPRAKSPRSSAVERRRQAREAQTLLPLERSGWES